MIGYRYYTGNDASPMEGAGADEVLDRLSDLLLHENDINKSLDLLKQQGIKGEDGNQSLQGIHDFLEQVRRMKQKLQEAASSGDPAAIEELKRLEKLEHELRRASWGLDLEKINAQEIRDLMGEQSYQLWNQLKALPRFLEANQLIEKLGDKYVLTPKGMRKIGQRALARYFCLPQPGCPGQPRNPSPGERDHLPPGGEPALSIRRPLPPQLIPDPHEQRDPPGFFRPLVGGDAAPPAPSERFRGLPNGETNPLGGGAHAGHERVHGPGRKILCGEESGAGPAYPDPDPVSRTTS